MVTGSAKQDADTQFWTNIKKFLLPHVKLEQDIAILQSQLEDCGDDSCAAEEIETRIEKVREKIAKEEWDTNTAVSAQGSRAWLTERCLLVFSYQIAMSRRKRHEDAMFLWKHYGRTASSSKQVQQVQLEQKQEAAAASQQRADDVANIHKQRDAAKRAEARRQKDLGRSMKAFSLNTSAGIATIILSLQALPELAGFQSILTCCSSEILYDDAVLECIELSRCEEVVKSLKSEKQSLELNIQVIKLLASFGC